MLLNQSQPRNTERADTGGVSMSNLLKFVYGGDILASATFNINVLPLIIEPSILLFFVQEAPFILYSCTY
jgi:hypothetical protein